MSGRHEDMRALDRYTATAERVADRIISSYSTSFGLATRLLGRRHRRHVRNIYALVRIADELVDGVAAEAGVPLHRQREQLDALEAELEAAIQRGYSTNPVVHAFACTARLAGIDATLTRPFFASMRMDLQEMAAATAGEHRVAVTYDAAAHADYVYGSAEVIGLMCLRVFMRAEECAPDVAHTLECGARQLGAAFQNVNFLRDLAEDRDRLGRNYLGLDRRVTAPQRDRWIRTIDVQLDDAARAIPLLPGDARLAVGCAHRLFARLARQLAAAPVEDLAQRRLRVSDPVKAVLVLQSALELSRGRVK